MAFTMSVHHPAFGGEPGHESGLRGQFARILPVAVLGEGGCFANSLKNLAPRAEISRPKEINGLRCQTILNVAFEHKRLCGALSNLTDGAVPDIRRIIAAIGIMWTMCAITKMVLTEMVVPPAAIWAILAVAI